MNVELEQLRADHADAVLAFELANRAYFAASVTDRGDDYFAQFRARFADLLEAQQRGEYAGYLVLAGDGTVSGRFNLELADPAAAAVGYRVARDASRRGLATAAVGELCRLAADTHGLSALRAAVADRNPASVRVLTKNGFVPAEPARRAELGGRPGRWYERSL